MSADTKTQLIIQLLAADVPKNQIMARVNCSQALVYKTMHRHMDEVARIKAGQPQMAPAQTPAQAAPAQLPPPAPAACSSRPKETPEIKLDPTKPAAPQLEAMAWATVAQAAAGGDVTVKQINAAREIIKQALRDKTPAPVDRKLVFKISEIDVAPPGSAQDFMVTNVHTYEIKP